MWHFAERSQGGGAKRSRTASAVGLLGVGLLGLKGAVHCGAVAAALARGRKARRKQRRK